MANYSTSTESSTQAAAEAAETVDIAASIVEVLPVTEEGAVGGEESSPIPPETESQEDAPIDCEPAQVAGSGTNYSRKAGPMGEMKS